jgi:hypothetical protein
MYIYYQIMLWFVYYIEEEEEEEEEGQKHTAQSSPNSSPNEL